MSKEKVFNFFIFADDLDKPLITRYGAVMYELEGSDEEKVHYLQEKVRSDHPDCKVFPIPSNRILVLSGNRQIEGAISLSVLFDELDRNNLSVFEAAFDFYDAPRSVLYVATVVHEGVPLIKSFK